MQSKENSLRNVPAMMAGLMLCLLLSALDNSIVATAMPRIIGDLQGIEHYSLPFTSYLLFSTVSIPIAGKLSDVYGRKLIVLWGLICFLITSVICALSVSMPMLILGRGLQGACGGVLASSTFIITSELFPFEERGKYIGILASMHGLASLLGPVAGGLITEYLSWRWIFFINVPVGATAFFFLNRYLKLERHVDADSRLDIKGLLAFLSGIFPLLFCLTEGGKLLPWNSPILIILLIFSACMLFCFYKMEQKSQSPMLPAEMLKNKIFRKAAFTAALGYVALFGIILYVPYLLQIVLKKGVAFSGMMMLPMSLSMVAGGMAGGFLVSRFQKYRRLSIVNFSIAITGFSILLFFGKDIPMPLVATAMLLCGLGIGMNFPIVNIMPQSVISVAQMGILLSTIEFFQIMGGVFSTSVLGKMLHVSLPGLLWFCIAALVTGIISMAFLNEKVVKRGFARQQNKSL
ncbi:MFS transporter [uncultured Bacteroides sp.]|uniref:MFS transporter n=1 Tax=uncultured Bacteroides sp. TaxID=162156 RepID=UPI002AAB60A0|nr:MFS transporter [uncultured Bacteroides sp.]